MKHKWLVCLIPLMLISSVMILLPDSVRADTSQWWTYYPGALNASSARIAPSPTALTDCDPVKIRGDSSTWQFYATASHVQLIETNDFIENDTWYQPDPPLDASYIVGYMPPDNATVISVSLVVVFENYLPGGQISFSIDDKATWTYETVPSTYYNYQVNVTEYANWTPEILKSNETWVRGVFSCAANTYYYADYIGFIVHWSAPYGGGGDAFPTEPDGGFPYDFLYDGAGIVALFGVMGFVGMIGVPVFAAWSFKTGREGSKIALAVQMIVVETFCFTMFLVSIS